ncbi:hypothetical protein AAHC03_026935 [Spirometra sp. Aus1]
MRTFNCSEKDVILKSADEGKNLRLCRPVEAADQINLKDDKTKRKRCSPQARRARNLPLIGLPLILGTTLVGGFLFFMVIIVVRHERWRRRTRRSLIPEASVDCFIITMPSVAPNSVNSFLILSVFPTPIPSSTYRTNSERLSTGPLSLSRLIYELPLREWAFSSAHCDPRDPQDAKVN